MSNNCEKELQEIEKLKQSIQKNKELFATFSHDIRNFIHSVLGFLDLLALEEDNPSKIDYIKSAQNSVSLILSLVNDIVELSKIEEGKLKINDYFYIPIDEYKSVYRVFYPSAINKNIFFLGFFDPLLPYAVKGDEYRIKQIISNILSNAIKFTPEGGIIKFHVNYKSRTNTIEFTISDSGIGMSKEELDKLFKPFEQANEMTATQYGGSGLGMSIVFNLVNMMNGKIRVRSKKGKGTTFKISLPCNTYSDMPSAIDKKNFEKYKFVVVKDDDPLNREILGLIKRYFRRLGLDFELIKKKDIYETLKRSDDFLLIIPDLSDTFCTSTYCDKEILKSGKKVIFVKRLKSVNYEVSENIKILPIPFIGGNLFKTIKESFAKQRFIDEKEEAVKEHKILSILVVDDNPINLKIMNEILKSFHMVPLLAQDEIEAMEILNKNNVDLIFVDEQMPTINGHELIKRIKAIPAFRHIKAYGLTGDNKEETIELLKESGAEDVLLKPISKDRLKLLFDELA